MKLFCSKSEIDIVLGGRLKISFIFLFTCLVTACTTNGYKNFYRDQTGGVPLNQLPVIIPTGEPRLVSGSLLDKDIETMQEEGFYLLGYSSFNGPIQDSRDALDFAKTIRAEVVIVYSTYRNSVTSALPVSTPTTHTSYTYPYGTTTTYGTQTSYVPYTVERYDQSATYWVSGKPSIFGLIVKDLSDEKKQEIESNRGVEVDVVIKGSPAFNSDFLKGDVIKSLNGSEIPDMSAYYKLERTCLKKAFPLRRRIQNVENALSSAQPSKTAAFLCSRKRERRYFG